MSINFKQIDSNLPARPTRNIGEKLTAGFQAITLTFIALPIQATAGLVCGVSKIFFHSLNPFAEKKENSTFSSRTIEIIKDAGKSFLPAKRTGLAALACLGIKVTGSGIELNRNSKNETCSYIFNAKGYAKQLLKGGDSEKKQYQKLTTMSHKLYTLAEKNLKKLLEIMENTTPNLTKFNDCMKKIELKINEIKEYQDEINEKTINLNAKGKISLAEINRNTASLIEEQEKLNVEINDIIKSLNKGDLINNAIDDSLEEDMDFSTTNNEDSNNPLSLNNPFFNNLSIGHKSEIIKIKIEEFKIEIEGIKISASQHKNNKNSNQFDEKLKFFQTKKSDLIYEISNLIKDLKNTPASTTTNSRDSTGSYLYDESRRSSSNSRDSTDSTTTSWSKYGEEN